jgi:hypothetical protein
VDLPPCKPDLFQGDLEVLKILIDASDTVLKSLGNTSVFEPAVNIFG